VSAFVAAGAGFLLAVLWFDLMFDVQVIGQRRGELPDAVLDSISAYYRRVTTSARPMNRLVAAVMLATLGSIVAELLRRDPSRWAAWASLALAAVAILTASLRTVPSAIRLGTANDSATRQSELARGILRQHVLCFASMASVLTLQLAFD
jgi:ER membrane protein SH3